MYIPKTLSHINDIGAWGPNIEADGMSAFINVRFGGEGDGVSAFINVQVGGPRRQG